MNRRTYLALVAGMAYESTNNRIPINNRPNESNRVLEYGRMRY